MDAYHEYNDHKFCEKSFIMLRVAVLATPDRLLLPFPMPGSKTGHGTKNKIIVCGNNV